jgi:hypothetical protein
VKDWWRRFRRSKPPVANYDALDRGTGVTFGDAVRVRRTPMTVAANVADRTGIVLGRTTRSLGLASNVIGDESGGLAVSVTFDDSSESAWLAPELVEFIDHRPGTTVGIGEKRLVRDADGNWVRARKSDERAGS